MFLTWYILTFKKNVLQYIACSTTRILCQNCHDLNKKLYSGDIKSFDLVPKLRFRLVDIFISVHTKAQSTKEKKSKLTSNPVFYFEYIHEKISQFSAYAHLLTIHRFQYIFLPCIYSTRKVSSNHTGYAWRWTQVTVSQMYFR